MAVTPLEAMARVIEDVVENADTTALYAPTLKTLIDANQLVTKKTTSWNWDAKVGGSSSGRKLVTTTGTATNQNVVRPATLGIGRHQIYTNFSVNLVDLTQALELAPDDVSQEIKVDVSDSIEDLLSDLNTLIYTGTGNDASAGVVGMGVIGDPAVPYATIDPATYPLWKPIVLGNGGTPRALTPALLRQVRTEMSKAAVSFDMVVCHPETSERYETVFATDGVGAGHVTYTETDGSSQVDLALGLRTYMGVPIIEDSKCPEGEIQFWTKAQAAVATFKLDTGNSQVPGSNLTSKTVEAWGLNLHIGELPNPNSAIRVFEMYILPQFRYRNRAKFIRLKDLIS